MADKPMQGTGQAPMRATGEDRRLRKDLAYLSVKNYLFEQDDSRAVYSERALSERLSIGLASIRSAIEQLRSQGIVETIPKAGIRLPAITPDEVVEFFELRIVLEPYLVRQLAGRISEARCGALRELIANQKRAAIEEHSVIYHRLDLGFHERLAELYGNGELIRALGLTRDKMFRLSRRIHRTHPERLRTNAAQHEAIVEAMCAGRADDAAEAMVSHLVWGRNFMLNPRGGSV